MNKKHIYHSDIKPANIIINVAENKYQFIDFGTSQIIPEESDEYEGIIVFDPPQKKVFNIEYYGIAGSPFFNSPEKKFFWNALKKNEEAKEKKEEFLQPNAQFFSPFKCDVCSLGKTFAMMVGEVHPKGRIRKLLDNMMTQDWTKRKESNDLEQYLVDNINEKIKPITTTELAFVENIEKKMLTFIRFSELMTTLKRKEKMRRVINF